MPRSRPPLCPSPGSLRCCLVSIGSRGDVTPFIGLGQALQRRGHQVGLVVLQPWAQLVRDAGLDCHPVPLGDEALWPASGPLRAAMTAQPGLMWAGMTRQVARAAPAIIDTMVCAARDADVLVSGLLTAGATASLADAHGQAWATVLLGPLLPSDDPARTVLGPGHVPGMVTLATSAALWRMTDSMGASLTRQMQRRGGSRERRAAGLRMMATSPVISPPDPRWPADLHQVGRLAPISEPTALPADLLGWLRAHPEAVLMDFGSVPAASARADQELFRSAAGRLGRPVVVQDPHAARGPSEPGVFNAPGADHRLLLPHLSVAVHHGGAGTTYTALAAGRPSVVVPHLGDQAYYARRVRQLGVGASPGPRWRLRAETLARAVERASSPEVRGRSAETGAQLARENGAELAARLVERHARRRRG